jgi:hypothetical protein
MTRFQSCNPKTEESATGAMRQVRHIDKQDIALDYTTGQLLGYVGEMPVVKAKTMGCGPGLVRALVIGALVPGQNGPTARETTDDCISLGSDHARP